MNDWYEFRRFLFLGRMSRFIGCGGGFSGYHQREPFSFRGQVFGRREVRTERKRIPERKRR